MTPGFISRLVISILWIGLFTGCFGILFPVWWATFVPFLWIMIVASGMFIKQDDDLTISLYVCIMTIATVAVFVWTSIVRGESWDTMTLMGMVGAILGFFGSIAYGLTVEELIERCE